MNVIIDVVRSPFRVFAISFGLMWLSEWLGAFFPGSGELLPLTSAKISALFRPRF